MIRPGGSAHGAVVVSVVVDDAALAAHLADTNNPHQVTAAQLGLGDVLTNLAQILGSRIVDHNLDVPNPPNGYYVRWENRLQICVIPSITMVYSSAAMMTVTWTFPASFSTIYYAGHVPTSSFSVSSSNAHATTARTGSRTGVSVQLQMISNNSFAVGDQWETMGLAVGEW